MLKCWAPCLGCCGVPPSFLDSGPFTDGLNHSPKSFTQLQNDTAGGSLQQSSSRACSRHPQSSVMQWNKTGKLSWDCILHSDASSPKQLHWTDSRHGARQRDIRIVLGVIGGLGSTQSGFEVDKNKSELKLVSSYWGDGGLGQRDMVAEEERRLMIMLFLSTIKS